MYFTGEFFDPLMHYSYLFHMSLTFPFDSPKTSTKYLLNINFFFGNDG